MSNKNILSWGNVAYAARLASSASGDREWEALEWTWQAWELLLKAGLATYSTKIHLCEVVIRFLALVSFHVEFCNDSAWELCIDENDCIKWVEAIKFNQKFAAQDILSYLYVFSPLCQQNTESEEDYELLDGSKLINFIDKFRLEIYPALVNSFGGESQLFAHFTQDKSLINNPIENNNYNVTQYETENIFYQREADKSIDEWTEIVVDEVLFAANVIANYFGGTIMTEISELNQANNQQFLYDEITSQTGLAIIKNANYYNLEKCAAETGFEETELKRWVRAINRKGQAILQGPPGTGKTYIAERLAKHLIGGGDGFCDLVQFHPAYSYEDFMQGMRPQTGNNGQLTYPVVPGRFLEFCKEAELRNGLCVLIIDEINRANLSQVFGELMYLLEYRDQKIPLAGSSEPFGIPENIRIIGTMNTADRSIALVDHALRRRFAFINLYPNYEVLRRYHQKNTGFSVEGLIEILEKLNQNIDDPHYQLGISFFLTDDLDDEIEDIWRMEIEPYLEEYFFDRRDKVEEFRWDKVAIKIAQ